MTSSLANWDRHLRHVYSEPKSVAQREAPGPLLSLAENYEPIDFDWWEPRYDQPWRRQDARDREAFGGDYVAGAKSPAEGPRNPNRLRREFEDAERGLRAAETIHADAQEELDRATARLKNLKERLAA